MINIELKLFFIISCLASLYASGRSIHRILDHNLPSITVYANDLPDTKYHLTDSHIKKFPLFEAFNEQYLDQKKLPCGLISYRNYPQQKISGQNLAHKLEKLVTDILNGQTEFSDFVILKKCDFNFRTKCGLIVLKFKRWPFVAKLFMENPRSLTHPYSKGIFPMGMFVMGGTNRHLNGFTRIKNMENIRDQIQQNPNWRHKLDLPRKWFWTPQPTNWLYVTGYNVGNTKIINTRFPAIYAVIADEITAAVSPSIDSGPRNLKLCQELNFAIDPNYHNFIIEKETNKLVMYDTEHFPTLIGAYDKEIKPAQKYIDWYMQLAKKFLKERLFSDKTYQQSRQDPSLIYPLY